MLGLLERFLGDSDLYVSISDYSCLAVRDADHHYASSRPGAAPCPDGDADLYSDLPVWACRGTIRSARHAIPAWPLYSQGEATSPTSRTGEPSTTSRGSSETVTSIDTALREPGSSKATPTTHRCLPSLSVLISPVSKSVLASGAIRHHTVPRRATSTGIYRTVDISSPSSWDLFSLKQSEVSPRRRSQPDQSTRSTSLVRHRSGHDQTSRALARQHPCPAHKRLSQRHGHPQRFPTPPVTSPASLHPLPLVFESGLNPGHQTCLPPPTRLRGADAEPRPPRAGTEVKMWVCAPVARGGADLGGAVTSATFRLNQHVSGEGSRFRGIATLAVGSSSRIWSAGISGSAANRCAWSSTIWPQGSASPYVLSSKAGRPTSLHGRDSLKCRRRGPSRTVSRRWGRSPRSPVG